MASLSSGHRILLEFLIIAKLCFAVEFISNDRINASRQSGKIGGDIIFGGLFPIHAPNEKSKNVYPCGILNHERGIHRLEAMYYAVDLINKDTSILGNYTIGVDIRDTCQTETYALEESVNFFNDKLDRKEQCQSYQKQNNVIGVIGAASSDVSIQVANLLRLFKVPQISYASTSPDLNDRKRFEYFLRTVPPDTYQARVMADIISDFNWTSVHGIYSQGNYGQNGIKEFRKYAKDKDICVISASPVNGNSNFFELLSSLATFKDTKVVILFLTTDHIQKLLHAASKIKFNFQWLASEYWGTRKRFLTNKRIRRAAQGAITLTLETKTINGFVNHFRNLKVHTNKHNPWFASFWQESFYCTFNYGYVPNRTLNICNGTEVLPDDYKFDDKVPYVIDAVFALAKAVEKALLQLCSITGKCDTSILKGDLILNLLQNGSYNGTLGSFKFDENGSTVREYEIMEYANGEYVKIGRWLKNKLKHLDKSNIHTTSYCASPCSIGEIKVPRKGLTCCYDCLKCGNNKYVKGDNQCLSCPKNQHPNRTRNGCELLSVNQINPLWVIIMTSVSGIGISLLAIVGLFLQSPNFREEIVNDTILEMCYLPQYDIISSYLFNIILVVFCTGYALRIRKYPACFNEAKCIGFVMYTTCILWISYIPVYYGLQIDYRFFAICMNNNLNATSILGGIFAPKVYIALFRPTRNIRSRSGMSIPHVYSNQSFDEDFCASERKMTTLTEIDVELTMVSSKQLKDVTTT
eukprot:gene11096-12265_t